MPVIAGRHGTKKLTKVRIQLILTNAPAAGLVNRSIVILWNFDQHLIRFKSELNYPPVVGGTDILFPNRL